MIKTIEMCLHITRRNWLVYKKDFLANIAPTMVEPYLMMLSLGIGVGAYVQNIHGHSFFEYLGPGIVISTAMFTGFFEGGYSFYVRLNFENIYKAILTTPVQPEEVIFGEFIWLALKGALMSSFLAFTMIFFGLMKNPLLWLYVPILGAIVGLCCGSLGLIAASYMRNINQFQSIYGFFISPLFFFSGIFSPIENMPILLQWFAKSLPLYHAVSLNQFIFWNELNTQTIWIHLLILLLFTYLLMTGAFFRIRKLLRNS